MRGAVSVVAIGGMIALAGCGYVDENRSAAQEVAQAYLDAYRAHNPHAVCRILAPETAAALAGDGTCERAVDAQLTHVYPRLRAGRAHPIPHPELNPRFAVAVQGEPARSIVVGRYGSIWRVVDGGSNGT